jgi:hypothetical protein
MSLQYYLQYRWLKKSIQQSEEVSGAEKFVNSFTNLYTRGIDLVRHETEAAKEARHPQSIRLNRDTVDTEQTNFIIETFSDINDENNPQNWTFVKKSCTTLILLCAGLLGGWASANDSTIIIQAQKSFGVSATTESLSTGLYLIAFGLGSLISGPFSETVGRIPVFLGTLIIFMICILPAALAPNIGTQLDFRFFAGLVGCTAVTAFGGCVADLWAPKERALVFSLSSCVNFCCVFV